MGTDDIDEILNYSMMLHAILKYIKDAENASLKNKMSGLQKKDFVINLIKYNMSNIYQNHSSIINAMIDTLIHVSNNPGILKADNRIRKYSK